MAVSSQPNKPTVEGATLHTHGHTSTHVTPAVIDLSRRHSHKMRYYFRLVLVNHSVNKHAAEAC